jgi:tRNA A-37 threonylcarbamoyl transferase component Bud32
MADSDSLLNFDSPYVRYIRTPTTFIKRELLDQERRRRKDGSIIFRPWNEERLRNEAAALQLIAEETTIPVPKLIGIGKDDNGLAYLETEFLPGIILERIRDQCRMDKGKSHVSDGPCEECGRIAQGNARRMIDEKVLPQLAMLQSSTTGLNGFVLPPPWILEHDERLHWQPKRAKLAAYIFCHGDLAAHNIMMDPNSLEVVAFLDWENAGYFPPEFQVFFVDRESYWDYFRDTKRITKFVALIEAES